MGDCKLLGQRFGLLDEGDPSGAVLRIVGKIVQRCKKIRNRLAQSGSLRVVKGGLYPAEDALINLVPAQVGLLLRNLVLDKLVNKAPDFRRPDSGPELPRIAVDRRGLLKDRFLAAVAGGIHV